MWLFALILAVVALFVMATLVMLSDHDDGIDDF